MSIRFKFALTAVALAAAASANATSFASASIGPIQVQLIDLNPLDGVTSTITFGSGISTYNYGYTYSNNGADVSNSPSLSGSGSVNANTANASISQSFIGGTASSLQGATVSTSGQASGSSTGAQSYYYGYITAPNYSSFTLSANTAVVFSALGTASAQTTVGYDAVNYRYEYASSNVSLGVNGTGPIGNTGNQSSSDSLSSSASHTYQSSYDPVTGAWTGYTYVGQQASNSSVLSVSFMNFSSGDKSGTIYAQAYVNGYSNIAAAVPEPETYAMLLAGLGVIGAVARRRRARTL